MTRYIATFVASSALALAAGAAAADSWIFQPSTYSHDPYTGCRVNQYQPERQSFAREDPTYMESGYRHLHTSIPSADGGYDHMHLVQTWGAGELIRPYGEWQYPFRAGATPFGPWGNPQGPWTLPFDSWQNPYGLNRLPGPPWPLPNYAPSGNYPPSGPPTAPPYGPLRLPAASPQRQP